MSQNSEAIRVGVTPVGRVMLVECSVCGPVSVDVATPLGTGIAAAHHLATAHNQGAVRV